MGEDENRVRGREEWVENEANLMGIRAKNT